MKFINNNADRKMRLGESGNYSWKTVRTGEIVELSLKQGQAYGFDFVEEGESESPDEEKPETTEGKAGTKTVETKQEEVDSEVNSEESKEPDNSDEESKE